jgi:hypothetical protein
MNKKQKLSILKKETGIWCDHILYTEKDKQYTAVILYEPVKCGRIDCIHRSDCHRVHKNGSFYKSNIKISMIHGRNTDAVIYCDSFQENK